MPALAGTPYAIWGIALATTAGIILRPFAWPEWLWAAAGGLLLLVLGLISPRNALAGLAQGTDVYLFLSGMMLLAELARQEGLFDWLAAHAARAAAGNASRLFSLVFAVGTLVTIFLSNDATAVVLTPAVAAMARAAKAPHPLPYLLICAFVANAASFVLPISNPANLVIYGARMPPLLVWLPLYALPSLAALAATYAALRLTQRRALSAPLAPDIDVPMLCAGGRRTAFGIAATILILLGASVLGLRLGLPTLLAAMLTGALVWPQSAHGPAATLRAIAWGVLPLVGGLFVVVQALEQTGVTEHLAQSLHALSRHSAAAAAWGAGLATGLACNLVNNLPAGLLSGRVVQALPLPVSVQAAVLIGIDLGPNLSVTGSLATLLWLVALRREGYVFAPAAFFRLGVVVMLPALFLALAIVVAQ